MKTKYIFVVTFVSFTNVVSDMLKALCSTYNTPLGDSLALQSALTPHCILPLSFKSSQASSFLPLVLTYKG